MICLPTQPGGRPTPLLRPPLTAGVGCRRGLGRGGTSTPGPSRFRPFLDTIAFPRVPLADKSWRGGRSMALASFSAGGLPGWVSALPWCGAPDDDDGTPAGLSGARAIGGLPAAPGGRARSMVGDEACMVEWYSLEGADEPSLAERWCRSTAASCCFPAAPLPSPAVSLPFSLSSPAVSLPFSLSSPLLSLPFSLSSPLLSLPLHCLPLFFHCRSRTTHVSLPLHSPLTAFPRLPTVLSRQVPLRRSACLPSHHRHAGGHEPGAAALDPDPPAFLLPFHCLSTVFFIAFPHFHCISTVFSTAFPLSFPLPLHCLSTVFSTAFPLLFHCLSAVFSTAFTLPVHCLFHCLSTAFPLSFHCPAGAHSVRPFGGDARAGGQNAPVLLRPGHRQGRDGVASTRMCKRRTPPRECTGGGVCSVLFCRVFWGSVDRGEILIAVESAGALVVG